MAPRTVPGTSKLPLKSELLFLPDPLASQYPFSPSPPHLPHPCLGYHSCLLPPQSPVSLAVPHGPWSESQKGWLPCASLPAPWSLSKDLAAADGGQMPRGCDSSPGRGRARPSTAPSAIRNISPAHAPLPLLSEVEGEAGLPREALAEHIPFPVLVSGAEREEHSGKKPYCPLALLCSALSMNTAEKHPSEFPLFPSRLLSQT